jgi:hypothetical protein
MITTPLIRKSAAAAFAGACLLLSGCGVAPSSTERGATASSTSAVVAVAASVPAASPTVDDSVYPPPRELSLEPPAAGERPALSLADAKLLAPTVKFEVPSEWPAPFAVSAVSAVDPSDGRTEGSITLYYSELAKGTLQVGLTSDSRISDSAAEEMFKSLQQPASGKNAKLHVSMVTLAGGTQAVALGDGHIESIISWIAGWGRVTISAYSGPGIENALAAYAGQVMAASTK